MDKNDIKIREEDGDVIFDTPSGPFRFPFGRETIDETRLNTVLGFIERCCVQLEKTAQIREESAKAISLAKEDTAKSIGLAKEDTAKSIGLAKEDTAKSIGLSKEETARSREETARVKEKTKQDGVDALKAFSMKFTECMTGIFGDEAETPSNDLGMSEEEFNQMDFGNPEAEQH